MAGVLIFYAKPGNGKTVLESDPANRTHQNGRMKKKK
jgi:hypothetical protein